MPYIGIRFIFDYNKQSKTSEMQIMKVLVIGGGGREHALIWKIKQNKDVSEVYCAPGNGGIAADATCVDIKPDDIPSLLSFAKENSIDLTVVGPEIPLADGIVDVFEAEGLRIFGPNKEAAQMEASKIFAKEFMARHHIPTAKFMICSDSTSANEIIKSGSMGFPVVLKADGLAAGKGVLICRDEAEAREGVEQLMVDKAFGEAGAKILIERCLVGLEISYMVIADGTDYIPLVASSDYKRALDEHKGPNTGGMGAYAPSTLVEKALEVDIERQIMEPVLKGLKDEGIHFRGVLYCGLMITEDGPMVLEFNVRFGDPETQVILPLMQEDLVDVFQVAIDGKLAEQKLSWKGAAVTVVMAAAGYPGPYEKGMEIKKLKEAAANERVIIFHAGTRLEDESILSSGGRVLNVTATGDTIADARERAYQAIEIIDFPGSRYRTDIALRAVLEQELDE
jgi:phosphoribosylamine--glycine ligase